MSDCRFFSYPHFIAAKSHYNLTTENMNLWLKLFLHFLGNQKGSIKKKQSTKENPEDGKET